ncbi:MAG TPA: hypothetical protein VGE66_16355 [Chitinophagaceae bacterium]
MNLLAFVLVAAGMAFTAPPSTIPSPNTAPTAARRVSRLVNDIEALYKAAYRPARGVRWQEVLAVRYQHRKLQIVYRIRDRKEIVYYDVQQAAPRNRFSEGRSFVYDGKTGKDIFSWLQRRDDAAVLRQDLEELREMLAKE